MQAITDIGQAAIRTGDRAIFLNPSFLAMSRIGTPKDIVSVFLKVHAGHYPTHRITDVALLQHTLARCYAEMVTACVTAVKACCAEDIAWIVGEHSVTPKGKLVMRPGQLPVADIIQLARHLMRHGVMGDQPPEEATSNKGEYSSRFEVRSFVYMAVAHLGMSEADAWSMTMTSFRAAMNAKYPSPDKPKIPSQEDYDEVMDWADKMAALDAQKNGLH